MTLHQRLSQRAQLLAELRAFFAARGVIEVQPSGLGRAASMDPGLSSLAVPEAGPSGEVRYLQTSPESAMKQWLAAGSGDLYYLGPAWRGGEFGRWHAAEFTLLEWYRIGWDHRDLMGEVAELVREVAARLAASSLPAPSLPEAALPAATLARYPVEHLTYRQAFVEYAGVDPLAATPEALDSALQRHGVELFGVEGSLDSPGAAEGVAAGTGGVGGDLPGRDADEQAQRQRDERLDLLLSHVVAPQLGRGALTFVEAFPASQAALARLEPGAETNEETGASTAGCAAPSATARRFELFIDGLEIANGYHELTDAGAQRERFSREQAWRRASGLPVYPLDEALLSALEERGLPDCAGVALGVDRLLAQLIGVDSVAEARGEGGGDG
ncbi:hypothetical protein CKO15_00950 [Halorhodospira abdelmalekii]|uniref:EF-P lysine aminoacylase GenX n=1 Tax=Halorhodospira abdelmalekii TaxID=421629 RepID=UPI001905A381|nr:amino acid--tRNA ligase-related protein [Halorhodospira abdelmalekii]MBK1733868.1 hypothetical protein [Halorhodospira abdelmalekii]